MGNLSISVIIPTRNRPDELRQCIYSVLRQSVKPLEIIILDASTDDRTLEVVSDIQKGSSLGHGISHVKTVANLAAQRNKGAEISKADLILFTDDDCVLDEKVIEEVNRFFSKDVNRSLGGAELNIQHSNINNTFIEKVFYKIFFMNDDRIIGRLRKPDFSFEKQEAEPIQHVFGSGCVFYRDIFIENPADEKFGVLAGYAALEDYDFSFRINLKYPLVRLKKTKVFHNHSPLSRDPVYLHEFTTILNYNVIYKRYFRKHPLERVIHFWRGAGVITLGIIKTLKYRDPQYISGTINGYKEILRKSR